MNTNESLCSIGTHNRVVKDFFSELPGIKRHIPGDCYCLDCKKPIAAHWRNGKPVAISRDELV